MATDLENQARAYWCGVRRLRLTSVLTEYRAELEDDLEVIALYTSSPVIKREVAALLRPERSQNAAT